jgi:hypothetical protein
VSGLAGKRLLTSPGGGGKWCDGPNRAPLDGAAEREAALTRCCGGGLKRHDASVSDAPQNGANRRAC